VAEHVNIIEGILSPKPHHPGLVHHLALDPQDESSSKPATLHI
jgi:hypothetical protein